MRGLDDTRELAAVKKIDRPDGICGGSILKVVLQRIQFLAGFRRFIEGLIEVGEALHAGFNHQVTKAPWGDW